MADDPSSEDYGGGGGGEEGGGRPRDVSFGSPSSVVSDLDFSASDFDMDERFSQQRETISRLRAEDAARSRKLANSRLKIEKCASRLAQIRDRAKTSRLSKTTSAVPGDASSSVDRDAPSDERVESASAPPPSDKFPRGISTEKKIRGDLDVAGLLHRQIRDHRAVAAERAESEKRLEEALAKMQRQLEENRNRPPTVEVSGLPNFVGSVSEERATEMRNRISELEAVVADLREACKEKDSVIDAKAKAIALMSADHGKKGKDALDLLDDTKEQMRQMQLNFATMENDMKTKRLELENERETLENRVKYLEEANSILENERFKLTFENSEMQEKLKEKDRIIEEFDSLAKVKVETPDDPDEAVEEKGSLEIKTMTELTEKIEILEKLNSTLRRSNVELQEKLNPILATEGSPLKEQDSPKSKKNPKQAKHKGSLKYKNLQSTEKREETPSNKSPTDTIERFEKIIANLNKQILDKEIELTGIVSRMKIENVDCETQTDELSREEMTSDLDTGKFEIVSDVDNQPVMPMEEESESSIEKTKLTETEMKVNELNKELNELNKNMIKMKASHKTKIKQMQKCIDDFTKVSDANAELIRLQAEVKSLSLKIAELEEDKGNLQLHLVDYDSGRVSDSQLRSKLAEIEHVADDRLKAIADLETQKFDLVQDLHLAKLQITNLEDKVADLLYLESEHVSNEMNSVQMEEQLDDLKKEVETLTSELSSLRIEKGELLKTVETLKEEKLQINNKLECYVQENLDLIDKLDKLSAEKVSSAESIEIVDALTCHEKLEMERYQQCEGTDVRADIAEDSIEYDSERRIPQENILPQIEIRDREIQAEDGKVDDDYLKLVEENKLALKNLQDSVAECQQLKDELETLNTEKSKIINDLNSLENENKTLITSIQLLQDEKDSITDKMHKDIREVIDNTTQTEIIDKDSGSDQPKNVKNLTKEILRLKNQIKSQDSELKTALELNENVATIMKKYSQTNINDLDGFIESIVHDKNTFDNEIKVVSDEKNTILQDFANLEIKHNELKSQFEGLQQELNSNIECVAAKNIEISNKVLEISQLQEAVEEHKLRIASLSEEVITKNNIISDQNDQIGQLDAVSKKLKSSLSQYENEKCLTLQQSDQVKALENNLQAYKMSISELESSVSGLTQEINAKQETVNFLKNDIDCHKNEIKELKDLINTNNKQIKTLQKEKEDLFNEISDFKKEIKIKDEELHEIKLQLRKESIEYERMKVELENILSGKEDVNTKLQDAETKYEQAEVRYKENIESLDKKCKEQLEKLKKYSATLKKKSALCAEMEIKVATLTEDLQNRNSSLESHENTIKTLNADVDLYQTQCKDLQYKINEMIQNEQKLIDTECKISHLNDQIDNLINAKELLTLENSSLKTSLEEINVKVAHLNDECASYKVTISEKNECISVLQSSLQDLNKVEEEMSVKKVEVENLLEKLSELQEIYDQYKSAQEAKLQEREAYIESLETEQFKQRDKINRLEESISAMEERRSSLERTTDSLANKLYEKNQEAIHGDELEKRILMLMEHDELIQKQLKDTKNENEVLLSKLNELEKQNSDLHSEADNLKTEISRHKKNLSDLQTQFNETSSDIERMSFMENELKRLHSEYAEILKTKTAQYDALECDLQAHIRDGEEQLKLSKDQYEKIHNELVIQTQNFGEIEMENNNLKSENEHLKQLYNSMKITSTTQTSFDETELMAQLSEKDELIKRLELQLSEVAQSEETCKRLHDVLQEKEKLVNDLQERLQSHSDVIVKRELREVFEQPISKSASHNVTDIPQQSMDIWKELESQIVTDEETHKPYVLTPSAEPMVRFFDHDPSVAVDKSKDYSKSDLPDDKLKPKTSYVCGQEHEEGWGWENEDCEVVEQLVENVSTINLQSENSKKLNEENEKMKIDNQRLSEELSLSKQKLGKAMKKLKDMKTRLDQLETELKQSKSLSSMNSLDFAIQDELTSQIKSLEDSVVNIRKDLLKEKEEKESLLKRIDVLHSANEKLVDLKEKSDAQMEVYIIKNKGLEEKIKNLEWSTDFTINDESSSNKESCVKNSSIEVDTKMNELETKIKDLEITNEELQLLLNEQSSRIKNMETNVKETHDSDEVDPNIKTTLITENQELKKQLDTKIDALKSLKIEFDLVSKENDNLKAELQITSENGHAELNLMVMENTDLKLNLEKLVKEYTDFQEKYNIIASEKDRAELQNSNLSKDIEELQFKINTISEQEKMCKTELHKLSYENEELTEKYEKLVKSIYDSKISQENDSVEMNTLKENINILNNELSQLNQHNQELSGNVSKLQDENSSLRERIALLSEENEKYMTHITEMRDSLISAVNQRGEEIAELWKNHLSSREREFEDSQNLLINEIETLKKDLTNAKQIVVDLETTDNGSAIQTIELNELKIRLEEINNEKNEYKNKYENEIPSLLNTNQQLISELDLLNVEIQKRNDENIALKTKLESIQNAPAYTSQSQHELEATHYENPELDGLKQQLIAVETKLADTVHENEVELANMRLSFHSEKTAFENTISSLNEQYVSLQKELQYKLDECKDLQLKLLESQSLTGAESTQLGDLRAALESQEIEIVTLKENLAIQSDAYDRLNEVYLLEKAKPKLEKHVSFAEDTKPGDDSQVGSSEKPLGAHLDLALYMLYQRDMRCEELTVELTQLLEERDTLQLKLSNAIKRIEELRVEKGERTEELLVQEQLEKEKQELVSIQKSVPVKEEGENVTDDKSLKTKLSQLHTVRHARDIRLRDEREERQKQMELLQRDLENLPPEAAAKLREAHHTFTRDTQSTSTALLNWLWGKTPPKVVHM